jgi:plastocyanin
LHREDTVVNRPLPWGRLLGVAGALLAAGGLTACGSDNVDEAASRLSSSDQVSASAAAAAVDEAEEAELSDVVPVDDDPAAVTARDNEFDIENIQVSAGATVVWTNEGQQDHNIIPVDDGEWGVDITGFQPDAIYEHTFDEAGTYRYYCSLHGTEDAGMTGAVVVE